MKSNRSFLQILIYSFCFSVISFSKAYAQDGLLSAIYDGSLSREEQLNGDGGILLVSPFNDLLVQVTSGNESGDTYRGGQDQDGNFKYIVPIKVEKSSIAHLIVTRKGSTMKVEFSEKRLRSNYLWGYRISAPKNPIRLSYQPSVGDMYPSQTEALVEISTALEGVNVEVPSSIPFKVTKGKQVNDASINVISIIVPVTLIKERYQELEQKTRTFDELDQVLLEQHPSGDDPRWDQLDKLQEELEQLKNDLAAVNQIDLNMPESNSLTIDISKMNPRSKMVVAVVPLVQTQIKEVYKNPFDSYMAQAQDAYDNRKYGTALALYQQAAETEGVTSSQQSLARESAAMMEELSEFMQNVKNCAITWKRLQESGTVKRHVAEECLEFAITNLSTLYDRTHDDFFDNMRSKYEQRLRNFPVVIAGKIKVKDYYGGVMNETPLRNCEIYGASSRRDLVGEKIGEMNSDGTFSVQFPRGQYYRLLFKPYSGSPMSHVRELKLLRDGNASMNINQDFKP